MKIYVKLAEKSYPVITGQGIGREIIDFIAESKLRPCLITDKNCQKLFPKFTERFETIAIEPGEKNKNRKTKEFIEDQMISMGFGRDSIIIAFGGGVVGDLAGFAASTYNRGIPYIHVPTTLLAMVDSSIGGKTGVDTDNGKNLIGAIWQPKAVFIDNDFLKTLPENEFDNGLAEMIKNALVGSEEQFAFIEKNISELKKRHPETLLHSIAESAKIKAGIVSKDEDEKNIRKSLNYGHTIGHAIELVMNYEITHGKAVSIGMATEASISVKLKLMRSETRKRQNMLLQKAGLPTKIPNNILAEEIINAAKLDKKARKGITEYSLASEIGNIITTSAEDSVVAASIEENREK